MSGVTDQLEEQLRYYRARAEEYDATAYGDVSAASARADRLVAELSPTGCVLEIACGTGMWTAALARHASTVIAIDAAPEMIASARMRVGSANVTFLVADAFSWATSRRFDVIFFSAWLSHVPTSTFDHFWGLLHTRLAVGGRVLFVDEHVDAREKEVYAAHDSEIVERTLRDGRQFHVVKNFIDPDHLTARLRQIGWQCEIRRDGASWIVGDARPVQ
jgi:protein-L-isoaspartate O-methyltransferase